MYQSVDVAAISFRPKKFDLADKRRPLGIHVPRRR